MKTNKKAFTLVELIVVITILAILGTIAFISFQNYTQSARDGTRIADINNIKKNLEIFITEKWFYPLPDNPTPITYNGWIARTQWTVWDNVITNLRNLSKKPTDPLSNNEYTYSITNAKTEYQLAYVTEWWLAYNIPLANQANAATLKIGTAKVTGTYNEKILKVATWSLTYILAVPSIISTDITDTDVQSIITNKKLVYNNYSNIPDSYKNLWYMMTWWFDFAPANIVILSWATISLSWSTEKITFLNNLKNIYNGTILNQDPIYIEIINTTDANDQVALVDSYISNHVWGLVWVISTTTTPTPTNSCSSTEPSCSPIWCTLTTWTPTSQDQAWVKDSSNCWFSCNANYNWDNCETYTPPPQFLANCTWSLQFIYTNDIWVEIWRVNNAWITTSWNPWALTCDGYIIVCKGNNAWYTLKACNLWATLIGWHTETYLQTTHLSFWNRYQFGKTDNSWVNWSSSYTRDWKSPGWTDLWSANYWWVLNIVMTSITWATSTIENQVKMKWPCPINYHVPTYAEWLGIYTAWWWANTNWLNLSNTLKLPYAGFRNRDNGIMNSQGNYGYYWSSSTAYAFAYNVYFTSNNIAAGGNDYRATGASVRCIKNY